MVKLEFQMFTFHYKIQRVVNLCGPMHTMVSQKVAISLIDDTLQCTMYQDALMLNFLCQHAY